MLSNHPNCLGGNGPSASSDLIGDVDGPASATDNAVARFDGTTGKLIQNSTVTIADSTGAIAGAQSLTSPAATNLTLGLGTGGTALTLASSTLAATFAGAVTVTGDTSIGTNVFKIDTTNTRIFLGLAAAIQGDTLEIAAKANGGTISLFGRAGAANESVIAFRANGAATQKAFIQGADEGLLLGTGSTTRLSIAASTGNVTLASTTAGSSGAGALVVQGGISAAGASYFGGAVTAAGNLTVGNSNTNQLLTLQSATAGSGQGAALVLKNNTTTIGYFGRSSYISSGAVNTDAPAIAGTTGLGLNFFVNDTTNALAIASTGAATFAGAVTTGSTLTVGANIEMPAASSIRFNSGTGLIYTAGYSYALSLQSSQLNLNTLSNSPITTGTGLATFGGAATFAGAVTVTGALKLGNAYVGTPVVSTGYITIQDSTGTTYKVAVSL